MPAGSCVEANLAVKEDVDLAEHQRPEGGVHLAENPAAASRVPLSDSPAYSPEARRPCESNLSTTLAASNTANMLIASKTSALSRSSCTSQLNIWSEDPARRRSRSGRLKLLEPDSLLSDGVSRAYLRSDP